MQNVKLRLDSWRDAERRRDGLAPGSPEWREADEDARSAAKVFHAEVAQASARYAEEDFQDRSPWSPQSDRRTSPAGGPVVDDHLARWPRGWGPSSRSTLEACRRYVAGARELAPPRRRAPADAGRRPEGAVVPLIQLW